MRYFRPDALANEAFDNENGIGPEDVTARILAKGLGYPKNGTFDVLRGGTGTAGFWYEIPDRLWALVEPELSTAEALTVVESAPAGYAASATRLARYMPRAGVTNIYALTDSIAWNGGSGTAGVDSYVAKGFASFAGTPRSEYYGVANREFFAGNYALFHCGNGGARIGDGTGIEWDEDYVNQLPTRFENLPGTGHVFFVALGANDVTWGDQATAATIWTRLENFIGALRTAHPSATIIATTIIRRSEDGGTNSKIATINSSIRAGFAAAGADLLFDAEAAHADFSATSGNSAGALYTDGTHLSTTGIAVLAAAFATVLTGDS